MSAKKTDWSVRFEFAGDPDEDALDTLADAVERYAGIVGGGAVGHTFAVRVSVKAPTSTEAVATAEGIVRKALANVGLDAQTRIVEHEAQTMDLLIAHNRGETTDALVGLSDIAAMHGFSRQRAHELSRLPGFPKPTAALAAGRVWRLVDVERFLAMPRAPGRPRRAAVAAKASARGRVANRRAAG